MENLFETVLRLSLTAVSVIPLILLVRLALRKAPKVFAYALWAVVLFRLLCPFAIESVFSLLPAVQVVPVAGRGEGTAQVFRIQTKIGAVDQKVNDFFVEHAYQGQPAFPEDTVTAPAPPINQLGPEPDWRTVPAAVWLTGAALLLGYGAVSLLLLRRKLVGSVPLEGEKDVRLADHIPSPFVLGVFRPKIYLPSDLPEGERDYILLHERTHIRRGDHIFRALAWLALSIHWFNPLVWLAFHLAGKDMEMSCDETVLRKMGRDVRADYSTSLLRLSAGKRLPAGPLAFGDGDPKGRIKNVLSYKKPALWVLVIALAGVVCAALALGTDPGAVGDSPEPDDGLSYAFNDDRTAVVITGHEGERAEWFFSEKYESALCVTGVTFSGGWEDVVCYAFWSSEDRNAVKMELIRAPVVLDYTVVVEGPAYPEQAVIERKISGDESMAPNLPDGEVVELATYFAHYLRAAETWYEQERSTLPPAELEVNLKVYRYSDEIRMEGSVGDFYLGARTVWEPPSEEYPLGNISMPYPPFDNDVVGSVRAWWTDENRTAVAVSTRPTAYINSNTPCGYWTFTVTLSETGGKVSEMTSHVLGEGALGSVRMLPESVSDEEAVKLTRIVAKLLTAAEDYYRLDNTPASPAPAPEGVWMKLNPGTLTPTGMSYRLCNETGSELMYGESFSLQVKEDGEWHDLEAENSMAFPAVGYILKGYDGTYKTADWGNGYGELSPGVYRMVKEVWLGSEREAVTVTAEFRIVA